MFAASINKTSLAILSASFVAGFLVAIYNFSVIFILITAVFLWFVLERFDDAVLLLVFYIPFQIALNLSAGFDVASGRVLILLFFMIWIARSLKNKELKIDFSLQTLLIILFLFLAVLSFGWAYEKDWAFRKLLVLLSVFPLYFILVSFSASRLFILKTVKYIFLGGFIISVFAILQFFAQFYFGIDSMFGFFAKAIAPVFYGNTFAAAVVANPSWLVNVGGATLLRAFAIFPDPHMLSFYLGLIVPPSLAFVLLDKNDFKKAGFVENKIVFYVLFIAMILAELLTFSRGGYLGMATSFFVMTILFWRRLTRFQKGTIAAVVVSGVAFVYLINPSVFARFMSSFDVREGSNVERIKNWQQGWDIFSNNIATGVGIGNYSFYMDPTVDYRTPIYAHNLYLDLGAELGVVAFLVWILLILITILELYKASKNTSDKTLSYLSLGLIGSLVWYSAHSFFDNSFYAPNILSMLVVIISLSVLVVRCNKKAE